MNPIERTVRRVDAWQQRHRLSAFTFATFKKFGDDQAGNLVALLTYFAFVSVFPLLLALTGILGIVLHGNPRLQHTLENSALVDFPIIGQQMHSQLGVSSLHHHSGPVLIIGIVGALLGGRGLANAIQNTLNTLWNVPKVDRPGFPSNWLRTFALIGLMGVGAVVTAGAASVAGSSHIFGSALVVKVIAFVLSTLVDAGLFLAAFRLGTAGIVATRDLWLGAVLAAIAWQVLLGFAGVIVSHDLRHAQEIAGLFGLVLGLLAWLGLQATVTVYAIEADVVRARRLWPRSITQPPLTEGDKRYLSLTTDAEVRRPEQQVQVEFSPEADADPLRAPASD